ncbi:hypothetical protein GGF43_003728, partial [Coemansia sp. RSA 2618]
MRLGSNSSNGNSGRAGEPAERYHLSFNSRDSTSRVGSRRRVFARLAPHNVDLPGSGRAYERSVAASGGAIDDSSEDGEAFVSSESFLGGEALVDGEVNADQYFDRQMMAMMMPPTPPRRRAADSDLEMDSASDSDPGVSISRAGAGAGGVNDEVQVRHALAQFGQLRRQRFLRDQRQWHRTSIVRTGGADTPSSLMHPWAQSRPSTDDVGLFGSTEASDLALDPAQQLFPSNDVDSYWYHQPEVEPAASGFQRSSTTHPATSGMQATPLRRMTGAPQVSRNPVAEVSRHAMLEVLRTHHAFASSIDESEPGNAASHEGREPSWTADEAEPGRSEKPEALDNDDSEATVGLSSSEREARRRSQRARQGSARVEERMLQWLTKNSVVVQDLSCALLRPGMRFSGVQRVTPQAREPARTEAFLRLRTPSLEQWDVSVEIQTVDMKRGRVSGLMKAINVPRLPKTVVTCWEGEIVDFVNYTPLTDKWRATCSDDARHWSMFSAVQSHPGT